MAQFDKLLHNFLFKSSERYHMCVVFHIFQSTSNYKFCKAQNNALASPSSYKTISTQFFMQTRKIEEKKNHPEENVWFYYQDKRIMFDTQ